MVKFVVFFILSLFLLVLISLNMSFAFEQNSPAEHQNTVRTGQLVIKSNLLKQPDHQSEVIAIVEANKAININSRQRAWYHVSRPALTTKAQVSGWVNMLNIRFTGTAKREGELGIASLFSSITNNSLPTVSTGIRGFDDEDLRKAKANFDQVSLLNAYVISSAQASQFAQQGSLITKKLVIKEEQTK